MTPSTTKSLLSAGYAVNVEHSLQRIFSDQQYTTVGATLVPEASWPDAPSSHLIVGLKELPEESFPLKHTHVQFAHCYKRQSNWKEVLARFPRGGGTLLDLEFLTDDSGRRVAAFGYHAGYAGAALAVEAWAWSLQNPKAARTASMPGVKPFANQSFLLGDVRSKIATGQDIAGRAPRVLVIGALGRCGRGAVDLCRQAGIPEANILKWDLEETAKGGPFEDIVESDIFVNCIYLSESIPPFVDAKALSSPKRKLSVVCDVSCDTTNPHNPVPIYDINTTFTEPTVPVKLQDGEEGPPLSVISIDHLPTLLPRESSEAFSEALLPSLLQLKDRKEARVWKQAEELFQDKVKELEKEVGKEGISEKWANGGAVPSLSVEEA